MQPGALVCVTAKPAACHDECLHEVHARLGEGAGTATWPERGPLGDLVEQGTCC